MIYKERIFFGNYRFKDWWIVLIGREELGFLNIIKYYNYNSSEIIEINISIFFLSIFSFSLPKKYLKFQGLNFQTERLKKRRYLLDSRLAFALASVYRCDTTSGSFFFFPLSILN